jgi:heptosyltransferase II
MRHHMDIKKVLFFKPGAIGDLLHALPALKAIKNKFPAAQVTIVVSPGLESLIQGTPLANHVQIFDKAKLKNSLTEFLKFGLRLRDEHYDLFVDMQASVRSLILRQLSGARLVLVYKKQKLAHVKEKRMHAVENFIDTLQPIDITELVDRIELPLSPESVESTDRIMIEHGLDRFGPLIALNCSVGAARPARNWFPDRFAVLADRLIKDLGAQVVFVGGNEDRELVLNVMAAMKEKAASVAGLLALPQSAALLARCACLVSSDTGPLHLATAVGTPVIGLFGSTDPRRTGPVGQGHQVLIKTISCVPCEKKECLYGTRACMSEITVDEVYEAVQRAIA